MECMTPFPVETERLILVPAQEVHLRAALVSLDELAQYLEAAVHPELTMFGTEPWAYALNQMLSRPEETGWWTWFPVLKEEGMVIGTCGYKGYPDKQGWVEIGYEIAPPYRRRGLATECASALVERVRQMDAIRGVRAHTLAEENASVAILRGLGFSRSGEFIDPDDGPVWSWALNIVR